MLGIITMYKRDGEAIRALLADRGLWGIETEDQEDVETATVDAFQGREKKIILVHFVSADPSGMASLGHIANARRLCVATTRAQEYQIFFGNLTHWRRHGSLENADKMKKLVNFCNNADQIMDWNEVRLAQYRGGNRIRRDMHAVRVQDMDEANAV
jgi:superfamily I DNA and/or RNA helicase